MTRFSGNDRPGRRLTFEKAQVAAPLDVDAAGRLTVNLEKRGGLEVRDEALGLTKEAAQAGVRFDRAFLLMGC